MNKLNNTKLVFPVLLMLVGMLLGNVPSTRAQSVQEWSDPVNVSFSGAATSPSMVVDSSGVIHSIWVDAFDGFKYSQSTDGVVWSSPITVKYPFSVEAPPPVMIADASGVIHIFWLNDANKLSYGQSLPASLKSPSNWRARTDLDSSVYDFDVDLDPQGGVHVTYLKNPAPVPGTPGVFYRRSGNGGRTWDPAKLLYESAYFRSLTAENAHIRMAVSEELEDNNVYVVWDDWSQKRIFIVISPDGGMNWEPVKEMVAPQENLGFRTPYNGDIDVLGDKVLATWSVGEVGVSCTPYSWSSSDGGVTWGQQVPILSELARCPEKSEFIPVDSDYLVELFTIQGDLSISAWNGTDWSDLEVQTGPSSIINPATFEPVLLGCERVVPYKDRLMVIGCDQGGGGDIWFIERQLDSLDYLFPLPGEWSGDTKVISAPRVLSSPASVADRSGNVHAVWIQSSSSPVDNFASVIQYAGWNGSEWTRPSPIITNLDGTPGNLAFQIDNQQRLLLSWVNPKTGELMFTWSDSGRASVPVEWNQPVILSASSKLINSPDILVDATDRYMLAYAVTLNEGRGIYLIQSTDLGETWSQPVRAFDAIAEGWEMVNHPKLAVTLDGTLHMLFTRYALLGEPEPVGVYYSQSSDGGVTWTPAEVISEQPVQWSELVAYQGTLHRLWQEKGKLAARTSHQTSLDGGKSWNAVDKIPSDADFGSEPAVSVDGTGTLHLVQVSGNDSQTFEEWQWSQENWQLAESRKFSTLELASPPGVDSGINSSGQLYALLNFEKQLVDGIETDIWSINRFLEIPDYVPPSTASISTPSSFSAPLPTPGLEVQSTPTVESPLAGLEDPQPLLNRNYIGLTLVIIIVLFIVVFVVPRRSKTSKTTK